MEEWFVYILYSEKIDKYYVGYTSDLDLRINRHNEGWGKFSLKGIPWKLVYHERFKTKSEAINRELQIKKRKSRKFIESLIHSGGRPVPNSDV
ncbi:MAG: GIY-YIG nuclease family protein [Bacteroidetes bacterium]|nr:GIY-YIG nuclease family protein [Bacteroidota bacterium]MBU2584853.1 GIY-YIG nuclease family protein [Bacteroidota bacterium]